MAFRPRGTAAPAVALAALLALSATCQHKKSRRRWCWWRQKSRSTVALQSGAVAGLDPDNASRSGRFAEGLDA